MRRKGQLAPIFLLIFICSGVFVFGAMAKKTATINKLTYKDAPSQEWVKWSGLIDADGYNFDIYANIVESDDNETRKERNVTTTYDNVGYYSFLAVGDQEKYVSFASPNHEQYVSEQNVLDNVTIDISAKEESATKVVVTYKVKNESDQPKDVSISSATLTRRSALCVILS